MVLLRGIVLIALAFLLPLQWGCYRRPNLEDELLARLSAKAAGERLRAVLSIKDSLPIPERVMPALIAAVNDDDLRVRRAAAETLGWSGTTGKPHLAKLTDLANTHPDAEVRNSLHQAIVKIGESQ